ncbi:MAG: rkpJ kpsS lipB wcbO, partial [Caulobacteraceae bacterium]|nr:rkpJ kpsS lipB wcbO [Caulobacteraceae bacterium]
MVQFDRHDGAAAAKNDRRGFSVLPRDNIAFDGSAELDGAGAIQTLGPADRHFLLICGPFGPFTRTLAGSLRAAGSRCSRVILNGGDVYDWGRGHSRTYLGALAGFGDWLAKVVQRDQVTDIVIYGDAHPYCAEAARVASQTTLQVHVLEQGYFRPFWITLERGGVNGNSSLPRDPDAFRDGAPCLPEPSDEWLPPLTPPAAWNLALYHLALWLLTPLFPRFHLPYQYSLPRQAFGHVRRYLDQRLFGARHRRGLAASLEGSGPLYFGILQRPGDSQLRVHSPFPSTADFIERVVRSFARHAPPSARLLFKSHPLDHGIEPHGRAVAAAAARHRVSGRVFFTDIGDLYGMLPKGVGAVTVNSTAGLSAVERGLPTLVLGKAIYDLPGLTHQGGLDTFWTAPEAPDPAFYDAFRRVVVSRTQISGAYAIRRG